MSALRIASQLPPVFNAVFAGVSPDLEIVPVDPGASSLPRGTQVLLAAPFRKPGGTLPDRPAGWPFDLRWVQLISVGIDYYPDWLFDGPVVTSARGSSAIALAEFALAAILSHAKKLPGIWIDSADRWSPQPLATVSGSTLGIFGFGAFGAALAVRAQALGMRVIAMRRSDRAFGDGVERAGDLADLIARSDHLVLAAPATAETERVIDAAALAHARPNLHLVNLARGSLIDDDALLAALDGQRIAQATLDVTFPQPLPAGHRFYTHPRVRLSAHTSVHTDETRRALSAGFAANLDRFRRGEALADVVDFSRGY